MLFRSKNMNLDVKCKSSVSYSNFPKLIARVLYFRKMQIICQNAQLNKLQMLVSLVGFLVKLKLPDLIKLNKNGRI